MRRKQLRNLKVDVRLNTEASAEDIKALNPYAVFVCTGSAPILPSSIKGIDGGNVYTVPEILNEKVKLTGKKVIVAGGGLTGMETAEFLQEKGNEVTNIDMLSAMGRRRVPTPAHGRAVANSPARRAYDARPQACRNPSRQRPARGHCRILKLSCPATQFVMSLGVKSVNALAGELEGMNNVFVLGEAQTAGQLVPQAVQPAFEAAWNLK